MPKRMNTILFLVLVAGLVTVQTVYGQADPKDRIDALIDNAKKDQIYEQEYKTELINRMQNTTCLPSTIMDNGQEYPFNAYSLSVSDLEIKLIDCVQRGIIQGEDKPQDKPKDNQSSQLGLDAKMASNKILKNLEDTQKKIDENNEKADKIKKKLRD